MLLLHCSFNSYVFISRISAKMREIDQEVKIIICTGVIDAVDAGRARASGADDYCVKTADYDALVATIKNLLKG